MMRRGLRLLAAVLLWVVALGCMAWAFGAFRFDFPIAGLRLTASIALGLLFLGVAVFVQGFWRKLGVLFAIFGVVLAWWLTLRPSNERTWQSDVDRVAWAEVNGDEVTLHNVRNCDYRSEKDFTPHWETRTVRLSQLTGADMAINYWGSPWMAHPIVSFQFADAPPVCFSIETRKEVGESYSAIGGIYRQYELIYIVADERDVLRVRSNYRKGEDVYLYRLTLTREEAVGRFRDYLRALEYLRKKPVWYNAVTTNCTTTIRLQHEGSRRMPWDWRMLVNGKGDEMLYERRGIRTDGLPFAELKQKALVNEAARAADAAPDFSARIRAGRPGFAQP